eukprot:15365253-Ditylum_brightwellii.AAC.1
MEEQNLMHDVDRYANEMYLLAFVAKANALDTSNYYQAINCPDAHLFVDAMKANLPPREEVYMSLPHGWEQPGPQEIWSYLSVVGMLMYLSGTTWPDIAMIMHQYTQYSHNPWHCHEKAVKKIIHYLISTRDTCPGKGHKDDQDPSCVKSWTGFVLTLDSTPILWVSRLQMEIAYSTMEAEYIVLSHSMRELLPACWLMDELVQAFELERELLLTVSMVWEDNNGALILANSPMP